MAVIIKTNNLAFLKKMGVDAMLLHQLDEVGVKLALGFHDFTLSAKKADQSVINYSAKLPASANDLVKGLVEPSVTVKTRAILEKAAKHVLFEYGASLSPASMFPEPVKAVLNENGEIVSGADLAGADPYMGPDKPFKVFPVDHASMVSEASKSEPVCLAEATMMYQRVKGTSSSSVYVVVAMANGLKIAARSKNPLTLSIRAEGALGQETIKALMAQTFKMGTGGGEYMSAHFTCNGNVTPDRVLGAVLAGLGFEFDTPFPSMKKVWELSS